jgi:serine/threonine-protein kinase
MRIEAGQRLGPYAVHRLVDESEFTSVFEVEHDHLGSIHALKILRDDEVGAVTRSIQRCARLQANVDHPNIVRCTDAGSFQGLPYLVMDWMNGGSLSDQLDARGAMSVSQAVPLFRAITRGVLALHDHQVVHRDLKPQNILFSVVDGRRIPKVTDLTLAKSLDHSTDNGPSTLSQEFRTIGTPEYMSPEQCSNPSGVDTRADLYSLGVILYELLTNEVPYEHEEGWRVPVAARLGKYRPMRALRPDVPAAAEALVADLLRPLPADRLPTCEHLLQRLDVL